MKGKCPKRMLCRILPIYILFLLIACGEGAFAYEILFNQIPAASGLSSNFVNCVGQSSDGYIWVGTQNGLQRYDGYQFRHFYNNAIRPGLPPLPVNQILNVNKPDWLMIRMRHRIGIFNTRDYSYKDIPIRTAEVIPETHDFFLSRDSKGHIFLLVYSYGIYVYNEKTNCFETNRKVISYDKNWRPTALREDRKGQLWISAFEGLGCYSPSARRFYTHADNPLQLPQLQKTGSVKNIVAFFIDSRNRFFINSWPPRGGFSIYYLAPGAALEKVGSQAYPGVNYCELSSFTEKKGIVFGFGVNTFNLFSEEDRAFTTFHERDDNHYGLNVSNVSQIFEDRDKNLWVATDNGLYMMSVVPDYIRNGTTTHRFKDASMTNMRPLADGRCILSSWGSKILVIRYEKNLVIREDRGLADGIYRGGPEDRNFSMVWDVLEDRKRNTLWLGCQAGRLIRYDRASGTSAFLKPEVFKESTVRAFAADRTGKVWMGTQNGKLVRYDEHGFKLIRELRNCIVKIYLEHNGDLWVATAGKGLYVFDPISGHLRKTYVSDRTAHSLSTNEVGDIVQLDDSIMAVACSANLDLLNIKSGKVRQLNIYNGLPQGVVTSLQKDARGFLWLSTIGGICRFDKRTMSFKMFDRKDGLLNTSDMLTLMQKSARFPDGMMGFCGDASFVIFNPEKLSHSQRPQNVTITDFKLGGRSVSLDSVTNEGAVRLQHNQNSLSVSFASLSYSQSNKLRYFFKLDGAGGNWIKAENSLTATFASLAPGDYTFMVRAINNDGLYSPGITRLRIVISPAFYQTWWFVLFLIALTVFPVVVIYRLRVNKLLEVQRVRGKVARDLHDDIGSTLTSINILSEVARGALAPGEHVVHSYLSRISKNSTQMMEAMDDIVWSIKPDNDQLVRIAARMREHTAGVLEPMNINYTFDSNETMRTAKLGMDERRNLFLIFKEALNNISKYAMATSVCISLNCEQGSVILTVQDNGIGFDLSVEGEGNGLSNMRKRALLLRGGINIVSAPGCGTRIVVKIPVR